MAAAWLTICCSMKQQCVGANSKHADTEQKPVAHGRRTVEDYLPQIGA